ncbi:MAG: hypothetical protein GEU78_09700 [Actinobacteria bacterium]|nr:hypothetical protein [Actinomycetota bacterium]
MAKYPNWFSGMRITSQLLAEMIWDEVTPSSNQTVTNSTTFVNTGIVIPVVANARYRYSLWAAYSGGAGNIKFDWTAPASGGGVDRYGQGPGSTSSGGSGNATNMSTRRETAATSVGLYAATNTLYMEEGIITAGTADSSATLRFAQNAADAAGTTFSSASRCWFVRVG